MEEEKAKASLTSYKGHFTRQQKAFDRRLDEFKLNPQVVENWGMLDSAFKKLQKGYDQLETAFIAVQLLDANPDYEDQANEAFNSFEEASREISMAAKRKANDGGGSIGPNGSSGTGGPKNVAKSVDSLKPDTLTRSMKPTEFRHWRRRFDDWYATSCFGTMPIVGQIAFLRSVIDVELSDQVDFEGATTIKQALERVEAQFMLIHPLLNRRVEFLTLVQKEGQMMSDHIVALTKAGLEADVDTMSPEDWKATRIISSCTDKEMRTKLLEMKPAVANTPTVAELEKVVADYEALKVSEDLLRIGATGGDPRSRRTGGPPKRDGDCFKCRKKGHFARECPVPKNQLKCTICNTKGLHNTFDECTGKKEYQPKEKKEKKKKKDKNRRSQTPAPEGDGSATETENEDSGPEDRNRRVVARRVVAKNARRVMARRVVARSEANQPVKQVRRVTARCSRQEGVVSYPTPPIVIGIRGARTQKSGVKIQAIPDTGCTATIISSKMATKCKLTVDKDVDINLSDAAGKKMKTKGMTTMFINSIEGTQRRIEAIVSPDLTDPCLVSWKDLIELQYLPKNWPNIEPKVRRTSAAAYEEGEEDQDEEEGEEDKPWPPEEWGQEITEVIKEFPHLFKNKLDPDSRIKAPPMDIVFKEDAVLPQCTHTRQIPVHLRGMADAYVEQALKEGVWERTVDGDACSPSHFVEKKDTAGNITGVRPVCDLRQLNKSVKRPTQVFPTGQDIWNQVDRKSKRFFKIDMTSGYHQVELSKQARKYFTFILPQGKFRYTVSPMGFVASGDWFNQLTDSVFNNLPGVQKEVDDILGEAVDNATLATKLREVLQRCQDNNITLSKKKMEVGDDVHFAGFRVGVQGCRPDPHKIVALKNFKTPTTPTEVRSFLGAVNQMSCWWPDLSQHCINLRRLTEEKTAWNWLPVHEEDFQRIKDLLSDTANLAPYDMRSKTELLTDASRLG